MKFASTRMRDEDQQCTRCRFRRFGSSCALETFGPALSWVHWAGQVPPGSLRSQEGSRWSGDAFSR